jgi:hypothetical protein
VTGSRVAMAVREVEATGVGRALVAAARVFAAIALIAMSVAAAAATEPGRTKIQTCRDASGKPIITDASDPRCYKPPPTDPEKAAIEAEKRKQVDLYNECKAEQRSLQSLFSRYPNREKHDAARRAALAEIENAMAVSKGRMEKLLADRKHFLEEAEFYPSGNLPVKLRRDTDANSALIAAQAQVIETQKNEAAQRNAFYDEQLAQLKKMWLLGRVDARPCVYPGN